jgi:AcrR family transcriptional regulator
VSANRAKPSQRERLLAAMTHVASSQGYAELSIADLTSRARVSRQTFYEQFAGKEDLFLAAYQRSARQVLGPLQGAMSSSDWWETPRTVVRAVLARIEADPEGAWLFFVEGLAGGPRIEAERRRVLEAVEAAIEGFLESAPAAGQTLDVPPRALLGAIRGAAIRAIAPWQPRIDAGGQEPALGEGLVAWIRSYAIPAGQARWSAGERAVQPARCSRGSVRPASPILARHEQLPRGRHGLPRGVVERNRRERIILATAEVIQEKGYAAVTVGDIATAAGIGKGVFYEHFADKRHVFAVAQQHAAQETFNACARAYFAGPTWPERIYAGLRTLSAIVAAEPALAHLRILAPYAAGPEAIERTQQTAMLFAAFLEEGYSRRPQAEHLPRACSAAIVDAVFEIIRAEIAAGRAGELSHQVPLLSYVAIAPFTGAQAAVQLIEGLR